MRISSTSRYLFLIFLISFVLYFPSLFTFYTNDDFFHLSIANAGSVKEFINFFNLTKAPEGWGLYRPLTTQVYYFLTIKFFNLNPMPLHVISFLVFFTNLFLVYRLAWEMTKNRITSLLSAFFYGTSATHFGHLYFLGAFQELGMAFFFLLSVISFLRFLESEKLVVYFLSFVTFVLSLFSKETAVILPLVLVIVYWYLKTVRKTKISFRKVCVSLTPYYILLATYFYLRFAHYGFAQGESYIWNFSIGRAFNTLGWYGLWSFNLPEMLVDFVGPGFKFNPNLFMFWSPQIIPIFILFGIELLLLFYLILKSKFLNLKSLIHNQYSASWFFPCWFIVTLLPVLFLPLHKFTFYLTLPLIGVVIFIAHVLISNRKSIFYILFSATWLLLSLVTLNLTKETHWITRGAETAKNVHNYFIANKSLLSDHEIVAFYDTYEDKDLPWSPSQVVKVVLSNQNYFTVFWDSEWEAKYLSYDINIISTKQNELMLKSRTFLGY